MNCLSGVRLSSSVGRLGVALALGLLAAGSAGAGAVSSATTGWGVQPSPNPNPNFKNVLNGVAATSPTNAWAVGSHRGRPLIERWNGGAWKVQKSPNPSGSRGLVSVAATSRTNAWAVGSYNKGPLIEHWNGKVWKVKPSPRLGRSTLTGVAATSSSNAWVVGYYDGAGRPLIAHWNGNAWKVEPSPKGPFCDISKLNGVAASTSTTAWAVGDCFSIAGGSDEIVTTLIEHWNGKAWKVQKSPNPGSNCCFPNRNLSGVAAASANDAWAVGAYTSNRTFNYRTLVEHWDGKTWKVQKSPNPSGSPFLVSVAATSSINAWAVGFYSNSISTGADKTLIEYWNGNAWNLQESPSPGSSASQLSGIAALSASDAWAAGSYTNTKPSYHTLIEHWNGKG